MSTLTFTVPGMTCGHLSSKIVTVSGDALDTAALVAAIDEAGFEATATDVSR